MTDEKILTLKSRVNAWECDGNDHLNAQFYFQHFDDAAQILSAGRRKSPLSRHVRFHAELHCGQDLTVRSRALPSGVVHYLYYDEGRRLSATAVDVHGAVAAATVPEAARPRGLPLEPAAAEDMSGLLETGRAAIGSLSRLRAEHCDEDSEMTDRALVGCMSNAAAAAYAVAGFDHDFRRDRGLGMVVAELKLTCHERPSSGDVVELITAPRTVSGKVMAIRHCVRNRSTGRIAVTGNAINLLMDLETRRAVDFPADRLVSWLRT